VHNIVNPNCNFYSYLCTSGLRERYFLFTVACKQTTSSCRTDKSQYYVPQANIDRENREEEIKKKKMELAVVDCVEFKCFLANNLSRPTFNLPIVIKYQTLSCIWNMMCIDITFIYKMSLNCRRVAQFV